MLPGFQASRLPGSLPSHLETEIASLRVPLQAGQHRVSLPLCLALNHEFAIFSEQPGRDFYHGAKAFKVQKRKF